MPNNAALIAAIAPKPPLKPSESEKEYEKDDRDRRARLTSVAIICEWDEADKFEVLMALRQANMRGGERGLSWELCHLAMGYATGDPFVKIHS